MVVTCESLHLTPLNTLMYYVLHRILYNIKYSYTHYSISYTLHNK